MVITNYQTNLLTSLIQGVSSPLPLEMNKLEGVFGQDLTTQSFMEECARYFQTSEAPISLAFWIRDERHISYLSLLSQTDPDGRHLVMEIKLSITNSP